MSSSQQGRPAHFADRLLRRCRELAAPVCVGIDPVLDRLPLSLKGEIDPQDLNPDTDAAVGAITGFVEGVLDAVHAHAPCVKFQSACFERYGWRGVRAYERLIHIARSLGLVVIADAKRGDIGISAAHYAAGCLGDPPLLAHDAPPRLGPDALTVNPYLGDDALAPFVDVAKAAGKGLFVLVRTSNPGGDRLQQLKLADGRTIALAVAQMVADMGGDCVGDCGYSLAGAVVGATKPDDMAALRAAMPQQIFLVPGFGAQGGTADDIRACFKADHTGALITASRSILYAYEKQQNTGDWQTAIQNAAIQMKQDIAAALG